MIQAAPNGAASQMLTPETPIRLDFERPPLIEQAISIVFEPIAGFGIVDPGLFWDRIRDQFPDVSSNAPVDAPLETFGASRSGGGVSLDLMPDYPLPRAMFRNDAGELVQVQVDRFGFNWAKEGDADYPRSEAVMARFEELFSLFLTYVSERHLGPVEMKQCELTNLNIIPVSDFGNDFSDMTSALRVDPLDLGLPYLKAETYVRNRQHRIEPGDGAPIGRLHTTISPVMSTQDGSQAFRLEFTARSAPTVETIDDARKFFVVARNAINGAFASLVTPEMRKKWGEKHG